MKVLPSLMIASAAALSVLPASAAPETGRALAITAPTERRIFVADGGGVEISLVPTPALSEGELIVLSVDDQVVVLPSGVTRFALTGVPSGTHILEAIIVDADANPVAAAQAVTFLVDAGLWI